ncbi:uncharacterized protein LOC106085219 isoform X1 [Stomoxys calcitrans]|uniref:uncharacterized protein LOC106085219 isoform X1 n=1 Tax=Stomoxys calcitrans TaxID=35570 RepID=UPI0027E229F3|nr:uncharacterized protein LOC106085219 isoform X1 [Stomoxys calcitrans]
MICRLCLKDSASIASVVKLFHNSDLNIIEGLEVARLIEKYLEIEVTHDDVISTMICTECHGHLKEFHKFRRNVEERQCTLRSDFLQIQVKEETTNLIASNNGNDCDRIIPDTLGMEEDAPDYQMDIAKSELDEEKAENDQPIFLQTSDMNTNSAVDKGIFPNHNDLTGALKTNEMDTFLQYAQLLKEIHKLKIDIRSRDETNQNLIISLTEELVALRHEVKKQKVVFPPEEDTSLLPPMPFYSFEDFKKFDGKISLEDDMRVQLKSLILRLGGKDMPSFMKMAIKSIISDEMAVGLTWRGTPEKPSIQEFATFKIIKDICQTKYKNATIADINRVCQQHVVHAKDRVGKKLKKKEMALSI